MWCYVSSDWLRLSGDRWLRDVCTRLFIFPTGLPADMLHFHEENVLLVSQWEGFHWELLGHVLLNVRVSEEWVDEWEKISAWGILAPPCTVTSLHHLSLLGEWSSTACPWASHMPRSYAMVINCYHSDMRMQTGCLITKIVTGLKKFLKNLKGPWKKKIAIYSTDYP